jgi:ribose transport system permease protein
MKSSLRTFLVQVGRNWALIFLIVMLSYFSISGLGFFSLNNYQNILIAATTTFLLAAGETFVIITGGIDLSVGYVMGAATVIDALVMKALYDAGFSESVSILCGSLVGLLWGVIPGAINGFLIARLKVPPFIATLGMFGVAHGVGLILSGGFPVTGLPPSLGFIGNGYFFYYLPGKGFSFLQRPEMERTEVRNLMGIIPIPVVMVAIVLLIFGFILAQTKFGQHTYAIGGNVDAAIRAGIDVRRHLMFIYIISSLFAALGGVLYVFRFTTGSSLAGEARMLDSIAAVVIGGASLFGGTGNLKGTVIGTLIIATLETGLVILGVQPFYQFFAVGIIIIIAVLIDQFFPEMIYEEEA